MDIKTRCNLIKWVVDTLASFELTQEETYRIFLKLEKDAIEYYEQFGTISALGYVNDELVKSRTIRDQIKIKLNLLISSNMVFQYNKPC
jgi:hypothetical protein